MEDIQYVKNRVNYVIHNEAYGINHLFNIKDVNRLLDQIGILEDEIQRQQEHLMHNEAELIELRRAVKWAMNNCKPERDELHSDFFNILTNAYSMHTEKDKQINEQIEHIRNKNGYS